MSELHINFKPLLDKSGNFHLKSDSLTWRKNPSSSIANRFRSLYLDPLNSPKKICHELGISRRSYYRLAKDLDAPTYKVAILGLRNRSKQRLISNHVDLTHSFELDVARLVALSLGSRFQIEFLTPVRALESINKGRLDFGFLSLCVTRQRWNEYNFSEPYLVEPQACGALIGQSFSMSKSTFTKKRVVIGVVKGTIHEHFAKTHFTEGEYIRSYSCFDHLENSLILGTTDFIFCHPINVKEDLKLKYNFKIKQLIKYPYRTAIPLKKSALQAVQPINSCLDSLYDQGILKKINQLAYSSIA